MSAPVAKILKTFAAEFKIAALKIGIVDRAILADEDVGSDGGPAFARSFTGATARLAARRRRPNFVRLSERTSSALARLFKRRQKRRAQPRKRRQYRFKNFAARDGGMEPKQNLSGPAAVGLNFPNAFGERQLEEI